MADHGENKQVLSFGCRLNIYESEVIKGHLPEGSKTLVVNTCAVTSEAERQARQAIRRAHRDQLGCTVWNLARHQRIPHPLDPDFTLVP